MFRMPIIAKPAEWPAHRRAFWQSLPGRHKWMALAPMGFWNLFSLDLAATSSGFWAHWLMILWGIIDLAFLLGGLGIVRGRTPSR